jgi:signal peptidase I
MSRIRLRRFALYLVIPVGAVFLVTAFYLSLTHRAFTIPTGAMMPNLLPGGYLYAKKLGNSYQPRVGDILVFEYPGDRNIEYIKRCVAQAGDTVEVSDGVLYVNGEIFESNFADPGGDHSCVPGWDGEGDCPAPCSLRSQSAYMQNSRSHQWPPPGLPSPYVVPAGHVFMMGDNRFNSRDSRHWGALDSDLIIAKASFLYWNSKDLGRVGKIVR